MHALVVTYDRNWNSFEVDHIVISTSTLKMEGACSSETSLSA
jgi:hypothetical protein